MKWVVNVYKGISISSNEMVLIKSKVFSGYEDARKYYWDNKKALREDGLFTELKPVKEGLI